MDNNFDKYEKLLWEEFPEWMAEIDGVRAGIERWLDQHPVAKTLIYQMYKASDALKESDLDASVDIHIAASDLLYSLMDGDNWLYEGADLDDVWNSAFPMAINLQQ